MDDDMSTCSMTALGPNFFQPPTRFSARQARGMFDNDLPRALAALADATVCGMPRRRVPAPVADLPAGQGVLGVF